VVRPERERTPHRHWVRSIDQSIAATVDRRARKGDNAERVEQGKRPRTDGGSFDGGSFDSGSFDSGSFGSGRTIQQIVVGDGAAGTQAKATAGRSYR
jgi:hypothetical protein